MQRGTAAGHSTWMDSHRGLRAQRGRTSAERDRVLEEDGHGQHARARRLEGFYGELTSVEAILRARARDGQEAGTVTAADLYTRSLDCQNLGGFVLLERHAA